MKKEKLERRKNEKRISWSARRKIGGRKNKKDESR